MKISKGTTSTDMLRKEADFLKNHINKYFPTFVEFKFDEVKNTAYLVMEYIEGRNIIETIENSNIKEEEIKFWVISLTKAVEELHSQGFCHRDIKPQNVMISTSGSLKLIDFGISIKFLVESDDIKHLKFYTQIGSPLYSAPEIYSKNSYDESVDIWGIGIIWLALTLESDIDSLETEITEYVSS
mmetsp:Transcript_11444/g.10106  ORF Transcript_11444/g.10106 Transcript_11444/m.10106 type:complete len:185 (-) Transcript_11444:97-651(-)